MTVDELREALRDQTAILEAGRNERHAEVMRRLDGINGRVNRHDDEITGLKVRDALWAGGLMGIIGLLKLLWR